MQRCIPWVFVAFVSTSIDVGAQSSSPEPAVTPSPEAPARAPGGTREGTSVLRGVVVTADTGPPLRRADVVAETTNPDVLTALRDRASRVSVVHGERTIVDFRLQQRP